MPSLPGTGITTLPGLGGGERPGLGSVPGLANRPGNGLGTTRPTPLPGRPGITTLPGLGGDRPIVGGARPGRPGIPRISTLPALPGRPGTGLPGLGGGERLGLGDRPIIGGGNRPIVGGDRPIIGSGNNRPIIGSGNTSNVININRNWLNQNNNVININRPGWGWGGGSWGVGPSVGGVWGSPGWAGNRWSGAWFNNYVPNADHGWYHGGWNSSWANSWYVPLAYGTTSWAMNGLSSWTPGYDDTAYLNPYYVAPAQAVPVYDYTQPIALEASGPSAVTVDEAEAAAPLEPPLSSPEQQQAYLLFDQARASFAAADNAKALDLIEQALRLTPGDPVMHEFRALCLFALGDYRNAAAVLNALLAVAPGWDWTTMSGLYANPSAYTDQLRNLESYAREHPDDPASYFVLAYHYLVLGHEDQAISALRVVTEQQPQDAVAGRLLQALTASSQAAASPPAEAADPTPPADAASPASASPAPDVATDTDAAEPGPTTDLVGRWRASPNDRVGFELIIDEGGNYSWTISPERGETTAIAGRYGVDGDALILRNEEQGDLVAEVVSGGPDRFTFRPLGAPPGDPGLTFDRVAADAP